MTAADLARIAEAIDADQRQTDVSNWPLSRERTRRYLALARAVAAMFDDDAMYPTLSASRSTFGVRDAFGALAPEEVPDAAR